jgi:hypothetical protein
MTPPVHEQQPELVVPAPTPELEQPVTEGVDIAGAGRAIPEAVHSKEQSGLSCITQAFKVISRQTPPAAVRPVPVPAPVRFGLRGRDIL